MGCCNSKNIINQLKIQDEKMDYFSFDGLCTLARVVDIYDGDTCTIIFNYNNQFIKYKIRAFGYDTCELHPRKNIENRDQHIAKATSQQQAFATLLMYNEGIVEVQMRGFDKYGRILGIFYGQDKNTSINDIMVHRYDAKPYYGGTK